MFNYSYVSHIQGLHTPAANGQAASWSCYRNDVVKDMNKDSEIRNKMGRYRSKAHAQGMAFHALGTTTLGGVHASSRGRK